MFFILPRHKKVCVLLKKLHHILKQKHIKKDLIYSWDLETVVRHKTCPFYFIEIVIKKNMYKNDYIFRLAFI